MGLRPQRGRKMLTQTNVLLVLVTNVKCMHHYYRQTDIIYHDDSVKEPTDDKSKCPWQALHELSAVFDVYSSLHFMSVICVMSFQ